MSEERDIEKQLRAAAEQRRKEAGGTFELHPATRRVLQGEVARVRGHKSMASSRRFWPRLAWGVSMLAVLMIGIWSFVRPVNKPAALSKPVRAGYTQQLAPVAARMESSVANAAAEPMPLAAVPAAPPAPMAVVDRGDTDGRLDEVSKVTAKDGPIGQVKEFKRESPSMEVFSGAATSGGSANRQMFANAPVKKTDTKNSEAEANVLNNFQLEQNGNQIRIVDNDGSVYEGTLLADARDEGAERRLNAALPRARTSAVDAENNTLQALDYEKQVRQNFRFAASGTNLSLRQRVTIDGELVAATEANKDSDQQLKAKAQSEVQLSNSRVVGRAVVADGQQVELDAAEVLMKK